MDNIFKIKSKKGLVSVIMPVFNGMPQIQLSIKSLLLQTYSDWECIVVNDGSVDGTKQYLDSLADSRFVIHHFEENKGRPYARQKGLDLAKGEYMAMLDADDFYQPEKLSKQVKILNSNPDVDLVGAGLLSFGSLVPFQRVRGKGSGNICEYKKNNHIEITHAPSMIRTEKAKFVEYNINLQFGQDTDFLKRYLINRKYIVLPEVLYYYSEFDSVNIKKIRKTYYCYLKANRNNIRFFKYIFKYLLAIFIFPLVSKNFLLKKRGQTPTQNEQKEFEELYKILKNQDA